MNVNTIRSERQNPRCNHCSLPLGKSPWVCAIAPEFVLQVTAGGGCFSFEGVGWINEQKRATMVAYIEATVWLG